MLSGIAFEMGAIIFVCAKAGIWLDEHYQTEKRIYTAIATLLGVAMPFLCIQEYWRTTVFIYQHLIIRCSCRI